MDLNKLNTSLGLLANFGVVVGILFLIIEIQQNQRALEETNRINLVQARSLEIDQYNQFRMYVAESPEISDIWARGLSGLSLTIEEQGRFSNLCISYIWMGVGVYERSIILQRNDTAEGQIERQATWIRDNPGYENCWDSTKPSIIGYGLETYVIEVESQVNRLE